jgi:hypothetical protein
MSLSRSRALLSRVSGVLVCGLRSRPLPGATRGRPCTAELSPAERVQVW